MDNVINGIQSQPSSNLEELLKAKGIASNTVQDFQEDEASSQSMTIANFSNQSVMMSKNGSTQNSLLQSVMAAASNSTAETSSERSLYGKQTANTMVQGLEQDAFEQSYTNLLDGLRADIEEAANEAIEQSTDSSSTKQHTNPVEQDIANAEQSSQTSGEEVQTNAASSSVSAATPTIESSDVQTDVQSNETASSTSQSMQSVDIYV